jgi:hypothetical protein
VAAVQVRPQVVAIATQDKAASLLAGGLRQSTFWRSGCVGVIPSKYKFRLQTFVFLDAPARMAAQSL